MWCATPRSLGTWSRAPHAIDGETDRRLNSAVLSVIILANRSTPELGLAMAALVPGAVHGLVHQVVAADPAGGADMAELCEDAGAVLVIGGLAEAVAAARREVILVLPAALRWHDDGLRRLSQALARGVREGLVRGEGEGGWRSLLQARPYGVLATRDKVEAAASGGIAGLRRRLGPGAARLV
jgi:hypothetical protein